MSNLFFYPTTNSWEEDVFALTPAGIAATIVIIIAFLALGLYLRRRDVRTSKDDLSRDVASQNAYTLKQLTFSGAAMALGIITSELLPTISLFATGGSITLFSMLFIVLIGYFFGLKAGITSAVAYGILQFIIDPKFYSIPQLIVDYPLAFGALGLSGIFAAKKHGLLLGYITAAIGRYIFAVISGIIFFGHYAPEDTPVFVYSLTYNASYIIPEAIITLIILALPPVTKGIAQVRKTIFE